MGPPRQPHGLAPIPVRKPLPYPIWIFAPSPLSILLSNPVPCLCPVFRKPPCNAEKTTRGPSPGSNFRTGPFIINKTLLICFNTNLQYNLNGNSKQNVLYMKVYQKNPMNMNMPSMHLCGSRIMSDHNNLCISPNRTAGVFRIRTNVSLFRLILK